MYNTPGKLNKVDIAGGPPQALCEISNAVGASWNRDGVILFGSSQGVIVSPLPAVRRQRSQLWTRRQVMALEISTSPAFQAGAPVPLFKVPPAFLRASGNPRALADVGPDGRCFVFAMPVSQSIHEEFTVVLNWQAGLRK